MKQIGTSTSSRGVRVGRSLAGRRHWFWLLIVGAAAVVSTPARAQNPVQPVFAQCPPASWIAKSQQVQVPSRLLGDSSEVPKIARPDSSSRTVIEFVVDTAGIPEASTFRSVRSGDASLVDVAKREFVRWRFSPAVASGCKVRQVVRFALSR